jgi:hypothetical protein
MVLFANRLKRRTGRMLRWPGDPGPLQRPREFRGWHIMPARDSQDKVSIAVAAILEPQGFKVLRKLLCNVRLSQHDNILLRDVTQDMQLVACSVTGLAAALVSAARSCIAANSVPHGEATGQHVHVWAKDPLTRPDLAVQCRVLGVVERACHH